MKEVKDQVFRVTSLSNEDFEEIIDVLNESDSYIFPSKLADETGFLLKDIINLLTILNIYNYLNHYVVPKFNNKIYLEYAEEGFSFNNRNDFIENLQIIDHTDIELLSVFKKHKIKGV